MVTLVVAVVEMNEGNLLLKSSSVTWSRFSRVALLLRRLSVLMVGSNVTGVKVGIYNIDE